MTAAEQLPRTSPAEQLKERFWKLKRSRIRIVPAHTSRASSIGHDCLRYLFYERTAGEMRMLHDESLQALFDLGNHAERFVVRELEEMGLEVLERGRDYHDRELELTGHIDGKLRWPGVDRAVPMEVKGLNPFTAEKLETIEDIKNNKAGWVRKYYAQLQSYLWLEKKAHPHLADPHGIFVLLNKVSGEIVFIDCAFDGAFAATLITKVEAVRDAVHANTPPSRHQTSECTRCPFAHVCLPDVNFGEAVQVVDEPELIEAIRRREELRKAHSDYLAADRAFKALMPEKPGETIVGPYAVIGEERTRKGYVAKSSSWVQFEVRQLGGAPAPADSKPLNPFPTLKPKEEK